MLAKRNVVACLKFRDFALIWLCSYFLRTLHYYVSFICVWFESIFCLQTHFMRLSVSETEKERYKMLEPMARKNRINLIGFWICTLIPLHVCLSYAIQRKTLFTLWYIISHKVCCMEVCLHFNNFCINVGRITCVKELHDNCSFSCMYLL